MHRAFNLSLDDGCKLITYYGYEGVCNKLATDKFDVTMPHQKKGGQI